MAICTRSQVADEEASFMTQPLLAPETPDVAEIISFLRRFADLMSNGYNASYLRQASNLLETLAARAITASDEEDLWRYKLETLVRHSDALDAEREDRAEKLGASEAESYRLRVGFDRERSELQAELRARGDEVAVFRMASEREIDALKEKIAALEAGRATLRSAFDQINYLRSRT